VMSVTGAALVLFLLFHGSMNLVAIISEEGYNMICEFLDDHSTLAWRSFTA
jgi:succinate dehydrogenase / fumarate reductase cytochrome b subunit